MDKVELEDLDWDRIYPRLVEYARRRLGAGWTLDDAEDVAQQAIEMLFNPRLKSWDPAEKEIEQHLGSTVNGLRNGCDPQPGHAGLGAVADPNADASVAEMSG